MNWKAATRRSLSHGMDSPRVLHTQDLAAVATRCGLEGSTLATRVAVNRFRTELVQEGALRKVSKGIYLNLSLSPRPTVYEAAVHVRAGAVVSLQTVLGDSGVINNHTPWVTSVYPQGQGQGAHGTVVHGEVHFDFHGISPRVLETGDEWDRLEMVPYPRATPEAALLHWLHLGRSAHANMAPPPVELDLGQLDMDRLERLARSSRMSICLGELLESARRLASDPSSMTNGASTLGF